MKKGAIFDMDGLMFDTERLWQDGWRKLARENGYEPSEDFSKEIMGTSGEVMYAVIHKHYPEVEPESFAGACRKMVADALKKEVPIKPGLFDILDFFRERNVKMAVASSSQQQMIRGNLKKAGMEDYFSVVLSSTEVAQPKPAPDVFLEAAKRLGLDAADCYVLEDSFGGVRAGAAAGAAVVMIPDQLAPTQTIAGLCAGVYEDLAAAAKAIADEAI
ncbi:MAG: HAD-IA family hydrolase [Lachnospiraceae bacterium]|nr:HAD-IA family hydrolase [Lachnospiraceae bacterium]